MSYFGKIPVANKTMDKRGGGIEIFRRTFFVPQCRKLWQGNRFVSCFGKLPVANKTMDKRWGVSRFSVESFFVLKCRKFRRGKFLCCVSEKFR